MQNNILFTFALILSIFAQAAFGQIVGNPVEPCSYCSDQKLEKRNPKIDRNTDFGLGVDPNYIFDRYTARELQDFNIFPYSDLVIDKPKGVCVYEHKEGIQNTNLKQGAWYPMSDLRLRTCKNIKPSEDGIFICPNTDPKISMCLITDGTAPLFKWYPTYPGKLFLFSMCSPGGLIQSYKTNGILGIIASKGQGWEAPQVKYPEEHYLYLRNWPRFSIRKNTFQQTCRKCPCAMKKQNVCDKVEIFSRVK